MRNFNLGWAPVLLTARLTTATLAPWSCAAAAGLEPETVLYSFCAQRVGGGCTDGTSPGPVALDDAGRLYGTTSQGGSRGAGTVFELTLNAARTNWTHTILYSFCPGSNCPDGASPYGDLIMDAAGRLYGTTAGGGAHGAGTVFDLTPNAAKTNWTHTVLYSFCPSCGDGIGPDAGLITDATGRLYGTTALGGAHRPQGGTVFELTPNATKSEWTETVLYNFCSQGGDNCTDGYQPQGGLIIDASGHVYGTTYEGGAHRKGTVFELTPNAARTNWTHTTLYSFCSQSGCADGASPGPDGGLIMDSAGRLYGTTYTGGGDAHTAGTVFALTPNAARTNWTHTTLYSFCSQSGCADGYAPLGGLIFDAAGHLYGTTSLGGAHDGGTVFELTPNAAKTTWTISILYDFCALNAAACSDGDGPSATLIMDRSGHLYGTTQSGGAHDGGTVFELP